MDARDLMRGSVSQTRNHPIGTGPPRREEASPGRPRLGARSGPGLAAALLLCAGLLPGAAHAASLLQPPPPCPVAIPAHPPATAQVWRVSDFGAIPDDDLADDEALRRAQATLRPGDWLVFEPGLYLQAHSVTIDRPGLTLWGPGATLQALDPADHALRLQADGVRLAGLTLRARTDRRRDAPAQSRLVLQGAGQVVQQVRIEGAGAAGILVLGARGFLLADNRIRATLADGIHVSGGSRQGRIENNQVNDAGDDLIAVVSYDSDPAPVQDILVRDNQVAGGRWGRGLAVVGGERITLANNRISDVLRAAGILVAQEGPWRTRGVDQVRIERNRLMRIGRPQDAAQAAGAPTGHAAIEVHRHETPPGAAGIGRLHLEDNRVEDSGVPALRLRDGRLDAGASGARLDCPALSTR
ncbi:hypothetical protein X805_13910 [Sphaerotilus natans subsp. natans DSM 6575]|uniref:Right handed beta helix domain-containing protein n=1 Tax=Sphaerotilus natans subsp. natans DSM 6575 TaxID=1286631 RepID=A0A059KPB8_9BURK|nr:right-handed parallel beta-helix repeat-containing protein [Sphaerotilus natans]KDB53029.1 hypothetical protein X805_13910 [Sphaerotilus natans subsp. natans DSM 6575]